MVVSHGQRVGVEHIDFFLAVAGLALGTFHGNAGALYAVADRAHHFLFLGGLEDVVILVVGADGAEVAITLFLRGLKAVFEEEKLQLGRHHRLHAHRVEARDLLFQYRAR